jgi:hypothetical protein
MMPRWINVLALIAVLAPAQAASLALQRRWESATVTLEVTRKQYDYLQPWSRGSQTFVKPAVAVSHDKLLSTAAGLADRTAVRVQSGGRGTWYEAQVSWVDYPANLALISVSDRAFWKECRPLKFARKLERDGDQTVIRWRNGSLEVRKAEFNRFTVSNPTGGDAAHAILELNSEIDGTGMGEAVVTGQQLIGLISGQRGNLCEVIPAPFIQSILDAQVAGTFRGLGYFDFTWQTTENPETLKYLRVPGHGNGVVLIDVPKRSPTADVLKPRDIILEVDGFSVDHQGDYDDPIYGHLMLESLSTRSKWAGDKVQLKVWRDGELIEVDYILQPVEDAARLVPEALYDQPPEYLIVGGLVFQPLTRNYLRRWGADWQRSAPFRLVQFRSEEPSADRPAVVILSSTLPDPFTLGYFDIQQMVLERVNGRRVSWLRDLKEALAHPRGGFHLLEFLKGESIQRLVIDATQLDAATRRVLERYGIESDGVIHAPERDPDEPGRAIASLATPP